MTATTRRTRDAANRPVQVDQRGYLYTTDDGFAFYVTDCCGCTVSIFTDTGVTYCKGCYGEVHSVLGAEPLPVTDDTREAARRAAAHVESYLAELNAARDAELAHAATARPRKGHRSGTVKDLNDGDVFSIDDGQTWYRCAVVLFGTVSVYTNRGRNRSLTVRLDAARDAACRIANR